MTLGNHEALAASLEAAYDCGEVEDVISVEKPHGALLIHTTEGVWLLRRFNGPSHTKRLLYADAFTTYLHGNGYPAMVIMRTKTGNLLFKFDEQPFFVTSFLDSPIQPEREMNLTDALLSEAGMFLARLHRLALDYGGPKVHRIPYQAQGVYHSLKLILQHIRARPVLSLFDELAAEVVAEKLAFIVKHPFENSAFMNLPKLMNHGDFHAGNIVCDTDKGIIGVLDFEFCAEMPRIWDIAWSTAWLCRTEPLDPFTGIVNTTRMARFLSSYHSVYPLAMDEQMQLCSIYVSAAYHEVHGLEMHYLKNTPSKWLTKFQSVDDWLGWIRNAQAIRDTILSSCR